jgi:hypothetical protein
LRAWNILVARVHNSSFVALLTLTLLNLGVTRYVDVWGSIGFTWVSLGSYPLAATLLPFPAITAIFHVMAACGVANYYVDVLKRGTNTLRWIEYSITNGLMSWSLVFVAGNGGFAILAATAVLSNFIMQYFGYLHEKTRSMVHLLLGFIPWAFNWSIVFILFWSRASSIGASVTDYLAIYGSFVWSICFTLPLFYRYTVATRQQLQPITQINYNVEVAYILLSLSAKLWLDWVIIGGSLS